MSGEFTVKQPRVIGWSPDAVQEATLIQRCAAGDEQACAELLSEHQRMVFQLSLHLLGDYEEALDLSQEVFLRVFKTLGRFRGHSALRTWIYRIVINQARNRQRSWKRRRQASQVSLDDHVLRHGELTDPGDRTAPDGVLQKKELASRVWSALDRLPFDQRTAVILREIDGLSYDEIAYSLGINIGTVKSRLTRARGALRTELSDARELGDI